MSHIAKYKSVSLKVNMKKSVVKKEDIQGLIVNKSELIRLKLVTVRRSFDKLEKVIRMSMSTLRTQDNPISSEYNLIISTEKHFCSEFLKVIDVLESYNKKYNDQLSRNVLVTTEISRGVEDLVNKLENGILNLPPP